MAISGQRLLLFGVKNIFPISLPFAITTTTKSSHHQDQTDEDDGGHEAAGAASLQGDAAQRLQVRGVSALSLARIERVLALLTPTFARRATTTASTPSAACAKTFTSTAIWRQAAQSSKPHSHSVASRQPCSSVRRQSPECTRQTRRASWRRCERTDNQDERLSRRSYDE